VLGASKNHYFYRQVTEDHQWKSISTGGGVKKTVSGYGFPLVIGVINSLIKLFSETLNGFLEQQIFI
jgi:hypothetical protein